MRARLHASDVSEGGRGSGAKIGTESEAMSGMLTAMVPLCVYAVVGINAVLALGQLSTAASSRVRREHHTLETVYGTKLN